MHRMRKGAVIALGGAMYALMAALGWQAERWGESRPLRALATAAVLLPFAMAALAGLFRLSERNDACRADEAQAHFRPLRAFAFFFLCDVPMFLLTFPGSFAYDVPFQLEQVFTGAYSTHHPLLHTLLMGGCVRLGHTLGCINLGAALYTVLQMAGLSACFAAACASIARQSGVRAARRSAVFFALYPLHMMMAVNATKDVLFSGLFALTLALLREELTASRKDGRRLVAIALCGAGMLLLRNNALYAMAVWLVLALLLLRRRSLRAVAASLAALALCIGVGGALQAATNAQDGDPREMLSWPIQQMARARSLHGERLTEEERQAVDALMPEESWRLYDPMISDPVKFAFDTDALRGDMGRFARAYASIGAKCPKDYADALLMLTYSFWYPYGEYRVPGYYLQMGVTDDYYDWCDFERISSRSAAPRVLASLSWRFGAQGAMQIPLVGYLFNMGVIVWVMLYFVLREAYMGRWASLTAALLPVLLWGTFLLGPVMAGRYVYPFVCCLPVLASHVKTSAGSVLPAERIGS